MKIIGVAVQHNGIVVCLPAPNRHSDCIAFAVDTLGLKPPVGHNGKQGFYLEDGSFLDREAAMKHALEVGQVKETEVNRGKLFSEDLW